MADEGSRQILDLLEEKSVRLTKSGTRLKNAVEKLAKRKGGVPAPIAFAAIDDIRRFYAGLGGQIASIDTASPAKADVLAALTLLDRGHATLERAFKEGIDKKGERLGRKARRLIKRSGEDLEAATAELKT